MISLGAELLISPDSHVIEDPHFWKKRLSASCKDQAPVFPEREVDGLFQAHPGGWDPDERVKERAVDGVSGEVLYPSEVSWIPFYLGRYDKYWGRGNLESPLAMLPSEHFFRQCYATFFNDPPARWIFGTWGSNNLMWSND